VRGSIPRPAWRILVRDLSFHGLACQAESQGQPLSSAGGLVQRFPDSDVVMLSPAGVASGAAPTSRSVSMPLQFCILGPLRVMRDDAEVTLGRRQHRALLARLLVDANRPVSVDRLLLDLWGDEPPSSAKGSLQVLVSRLRGALEPERDPTDPARVLVTRAPGYALEIPAGSVDAERFAALSEEARQLLAARPKEALERLDEALSLWRGEVLADLADETFIASTAVRLETLRSDAREHRAAALLAMGATASAIAELEVLTEEAPLRERPWELLLRALHAGGRTVEALERYRTLAGRLREELGLDPGSALQALESALLRGEPPEANGWPTGGPAVTVTPSAQPLEQPPELGRLLATAETEVIGRDCERGALLGALDRGLSGVTSWVVVTGEAGIGKTTLVERSALAAGRRGVRALFGRCHEAELTPAFWPWLQILRGLEDLVPGAHGLLDDTSELTGDAAGRLFSFFDGVAASLRAAAAQMPLLIVLEDTHWADRESLHLLDFLAVQLRDVRVTVVLTARREEMAGPLQHTLLELARQPGQLRLDLAGLDTPSTAELVTSVSGADLDASTVAQVRERTGGNPLFIVELARLKDAALVGGALPDTIREILTRRIERLPEQAVELLELAAVHGGDFGLEALIASSPEDAEAVLDGLDLASRAHLVEATDDPLRFHFTHALIRDAALGRLTDRQRRRLHLRIAHSLRALASHDVAAWRSGVAHHLLSAAPLGDARETIEAARTAALLAEERVAFHEASRWWSGALRVLSWDRACGADRRLRLELLLALGRTLGEAGDQAAAIERLAEAIDVADALDDPLAMADAAIAFERSSGFWNWVDYGTRPTELLRRLDRVLEALGETDLTRRVQVLGVRAVGEYYVDQRPGRALARETLELARSLDEPQLVLAALTSNLRFLSHHDLAHHLVLSQELLDLAQVHGSEHHELFAWGYRISHLLMRGDLERVESAYQRAVELSRRLGSVIFQAQFAWTEAVFTLARGDLAGTERRIEDARELHASTRLYLLDPVYAWARTVLLWEQDRLDELPAELAAYVPEAQVARLHQHGDRDTALRLLTELCASPHPQIFHALGSLVLRARLAADLGARELAAPLIEQLAPHEDLLAVFGSVTCAGPVATELGRLYDLIDDPTRAARTLDRSVERAVRAGWPGWAARAKAARADVDRSRECEHRRAGDTVTSHTGRLSARR
jgi:DNA-binding SARP family transcriptional activator